MPVQGTNVPKLFSNNDQGGYLAGLHLAEKGHREVLFVGGVDQMISDYRRCSGFARAMRDAWGGRADPTVRRQLYNSIRA